MLRPMNHCGAPMELALPLNKRPMLPGVCSTCGSIAFRCVVAAPVAGSAAQVWMAENVGRLLSLSTECSTALSPDRLQTGLKCLVDQRYNGSVVDAALDAGLSRASVCWWIRGRGKLSLGMLMQLCHRAEADIVELVEGRYVGRASDRQPIQANERCYTRTTTSWPEMADALKSALLESPPPNTREVARRLGVSHRMLSDRLPKDFSRLAAEAKRRRDLRSMALYAEAVETYSLTAKSLVADNRRVSSALLQRESGLSSFSRNANRTRAISEVVGRYS